MHTNRIDTSGKPIGEVDAGNCPASVLSELLCCPFCGSQPDPLASEIDGSLVCDTCGARGPTHNVGLTVIFGGTMEEEYVNKTLAQTLVWHGNKGFLSVRQIKKPLRCFPMGEFTPRRWFGSGIP